MKVRFFLASKMFFLLLFSFPAYSIEGVYRVVIEKQKEKQSSRWSLLDWMTTKKNIALMDQWLALNTKKTFFEGNFGFQMIDLKRANQANLQSKVTGTSANASLYFKMLGLDYREVWIDNNASEYYGLNLILLGSSLQSTNLRLSYGQRQINFEGVGKVKHGLWGPHLDLYLLSFIGVSGKYQKYTSSELKGNPATELSGEISSVGAFLEFGPIRITGEKRKSLNSFKNGTVLEHRLKDEETVYGLQLFL